ncbi:hypothetical protein [Rhizobium sp. BK376]|uniref:hypothetical protein n=1 Tax=Rhizobium sp. BK376 TaxID=2512149 RepID=UPI0010514696|nr:hypothetical protein [Rhizobium sp. BK376]TCR93422.1 hypothetical protein EV561_101870 [Rhizobium sp. BK376]
MFGRVSRVLFSASLLAILAGCNSLGFGGDKQPATDVTVAPQASSATAAAAPAGSLPPVIAGKCPQIVIRDEASVYHSYAKGAKDDPSQLMYQASLAQGTRSCSTDGANLKISVAVQGRLVAGPMGSAGTVTLPIHVSVLDGTTSLYDEPVNFQAQIPPGQSTAQFLFTDDRISVTGGSGGFVTVYVGFADETPKATKPTKGHTKKK